MKNLLLLIFILSGTASLAQSDLFVRPNPTTNTDSYIYVQNQILYVTDDVNLERNSSGTTEASIYLRFGSQLIQGNNVANQGNGYLSVSQDSNSDSYDYNNWSSPVGNANLGTSGNANFGLPSSIVDSLGITNSRAALLTGSWNGVGTGNEPTDGSGAGKQLRVSNRWLYKYENNAQGFRRLFGTDGVGPGYGFIMKGTNVTPSGMHISRFIDANNQRYEFRGRPNNGTIGITNSPDDFIMAGNPYPSAIDLVEFWNDNPGQLNNIEFWEEDRTINSHFHVDNESGYATFAVNGTFPNGVTTAAMLFTRDAGGGSTGSAGTGRDIERRYAPIGQGFVLATDVGATNPTLEFNNSQRVYEIENEDETNGTTGSVFARPGGDGNIPVYTVDIGDPIDVNDDNTNNGDPNGSVDPVYMRIYAHFQKQDKDAVRDMILVLSDETTDRHDVGYDVYHPDPSGGDAHFPIIADDGAVRKYVMQGVPFEQEKLIPLTLKTVGAETKVYIEAVEQVNLPMDAWVLDRENDDMRLLTTGNGESEAYFYLPAGNYKDRFFIVFAPREEGRNLLIKDAQLATEEAARNVDFFQNNRESQLEVTNPDGYDIKLANIYDMSGKLVLSEGNIGTSSRFDLPTQNLSDGVYLVKLTTMDNVVIDYKMTIHN